MGNVANIKEALHAIADECNSNIELINRGGCAVYAVELAKRLEALGYDDYRIRTYGRRLNIAKVEQLITTTNAQATIWDWYNNGVTFDHVRLQWRGFMWDAEGAEKVADATSWMGSGIQDGKISLEAMAKLADSGRGWNFRFKRSQIPEMRSIMDEYLTVN